jgi:hypothetical protein
VAFLVAHGGVHVQNPWLATLNHDSAQPVSSQCGASVRFSMDHLSRHQQLRLHRPMRLCVK